MGVDGDRRVTTFIEKPDGSRALPLCAGRPDHVLASMGIYVFNTDFLCAQLGATQPMPRRRTISAGT